MVIPRKSLHKWLAIGAQALCVLGIAYAAANSAHFFWTGPPTSAPAPVVASAPAAERQEIPLEQVRALHLFGRPRPTAAPAPAENLQETKLSLVLVGVFVGEGTSSMALIAAQGRPAKSYAIGDRLMPGNAKLNAQLTAVHADRVVITRDGVRELIRFSDQRRHFQPLAAPRTGPRPGNPADSRTAPRKPPPALGGAALAPGTGAQQALLSQHWEAIEKDPAKLLRDLGVGTVSGGGAGKGYALGVVAERPELAHTGLQSGDLLLSVNGHPVGDPEKDRLRLTELVAKGSLRLEIQRGERRMFITVAL